MDILKRNNVHVLEGPGATFVYAHGFGCSQHMWDRVTPAFAGEHRQVLFDYVGSGQSDMAAFDPERYSSLDGYAQDLIDVCEALDLSGEVVFVGHSVSCSIGMLAAIAKPALFSTLVLLGPNPCFVNDASVGYVGGFAREDLQGLLDLMDQNYIGWANYLAPVVASQDASGAVTRELSASFCSTDPVAAKAFAQATFFSDNRADVEKVSPACLVLQHRQDTLAPLAVGEYLQAHLQKSTLKVLDVSGHCAHMSDPALVIGAIRNFIQTA
ncbi:MAG: alpha/beta hydrolase [Curvibacter sp.]|nr:MAG: alpha/beta hydrolase [Curvibacter sp.]